MFALQVDLRWLTLALLASIRVAAATAFIPVFGATSMPLLVRTTWVLAVSGLLIAALPVGQGALPTDVIALGVAGVFEMLVGGSLAFGMLTAYAATQVAGRVLDTQTGFGVAGILNPATQSMSPLLGSLFGMAGLMVFLSMDGHHVLIRALQISLATFPPGQFSFLPDGEALLAQSSAMFGFGLALAAPVMLALFLVDIAMAVMARSMPQLNIFVLSFAIKIVLGLIGLALSIRLAEGILESLFATTFQYWNGIALGSP